MPLYVFENYLGTKPSAKNLCDITEHISVSDICEKRIRSNNDWNLLQNRGIHGCIVVGVKAGNESPGFPQFPA